MRLDRMLVRGTVLLVSLAALTTNGLAQSATCRSLQNQLDALNRPGRGRATAYAEAAQRQIDEMQRMAAYMRQIGCGGSRFLVFGLARPSQCGELTARYARMEANLAGLQGQAEQLGLGPDTAARRDQLREAIRQYCSVDPSRLAPIDRQPLEPDMETPEQVDTLPDDQGGGMGSGKPVCVRLCDGYFFPLTSLGKRGRDGAQEMCQAQCPGSETEAFTLGPDDDIKQAVGQGGKSYMELDNALRYQKATVPGCSCRKSDESWGQALKGAEDMLGGSDAPISADEAARMSRPAAPTAPKKAPAATPPKGPPAPVAAAPPTADPSTAKPASPGAPPPPGGVGPDGQRKIRIITPAGPAPNP